MFYTGGETIEESARRTLETCGALAGIACMIVAIDDAFVVPVPTAKVTGFFQAASNSSIPADARDDVARKLAEPSSGWNAVASGTSGHPGLALKAASEQKRSVKPSAIAPGPIAIAMSSPSARFQSDRTKVPGLAYYFRHPESLFDFSS